MSNSQKLLEWVDRKVGYSRPEKPYEPIHLN